MEVKLSIVTKNVQKPKAKKEIIMTCISHKDSAGQVSVSLTHTSTKKAHAYNKSNTLETAKLRRGKRGD